MVRTRSTDTPRVQPQFLKELQKREHEQTSEGRDGAAEADAVIADLVARSPRHA